MSGIIKGLGGWLKNSFIDFPGTVSTVLFFNNCNLSCPYCHNPDFTDAKVSAEELSEEVWSYLDKRKGLIEGVVLSGGEPTIFSSMVHVAENIRNMGYKLKLDTNGLNPNVIELINPDYLALDIKSTVKGYTDYLGATYNDINERLIKSISIVKEMQDNAEIRITVAPEIINEKVIVEIGDLIKGIKRVYLQKISYGDHILSMEFFDKLDKKTDASDLEKYQMILEKSCEHCEIR